ncbi:Twin-arginine translocation pathway signal precursor [Sphingopyxis sp. LC81]|uniref:gluconate 2-dehydrogenase subunit 3 family protein n=1 Tax=Sphingopyxis sp. LC81 TaxID=1502850 RepID=UPI00050DDD79|nr:gluconate 2-dehydrogenase subunit 3 family protein [Sphingopyxis sp. LC81]KGB54500.1 Twin-arginine translocation pathway signal precursor [Sphingopyxis sp. LC81]
MLDLPSLDRRALLGRAALLLGVTAAGGLSAPALAEAAARAKPFLAAPAFALLSAVADTIIPVTDTPGAVEARVPALLDGLFANWASAERKVELAAALTRIDARAQSEHGKPFAALAPEVRTTLLAAHDAEALKPAPKDKGVGSAGLSLGLGTGATDPGYAKLKDLVIILYYSSEIALTQELSYEHAPGEWKPSIPITPDTRPQGAGPY